VAGALGYDALHDALAQSATAVTGSMMMCRRMDRSTAINVGRSAPYLGWMRVRIRARADITLHVRQINQAMILHSRSGVEALAKAMLRQIVPIE
jgi:hypothetical protein